jgi:hypothetical protein
VSVDDGVSVIPSIRIFRGHFIVRHVPLREYRTNTNFAAICVRRVMAFSNIAVEPGTVIDTQYTVDAAYDATDDAANNRSHRASVVLADASAMISAIWYALSMCSGRQCECRGTNGYGTNDYDVSVHVYL